MEADTIRRLAHTTSARKVPAWTALLGIALFGAVVFWAHHLLGIYHWRDILKHVHAIPNTKVLRAAIFTCAGYGSLTLYDALAVRFAGARVPYPRVALISFMGYAIGHNVGLNTFSGGAVRYRAYTALGLSAKQIATIVAFGTFTFFLGAGLLLGLSLLSNAGMSGSVLHVHAWLALVAGGLLLAAVAMYLWLVCTRHAPLRFKRFEVPVPRPRVAFAQSLSHAPTCCAPWRCCTCCCRRRPRSDSRRLPAFTYSPWPPAPPAMSRAASACSNSCCCCCCRGSPGPIAGRAGGVSRHLLLCAVRRGAGAARACTSCGCIARRQCAWCRLLRTFLIAVTPQAIAIAVFFAGAVLLFSGATPGLGNRLALLHGFVPLPVLELSHLLGSVVGVGLLVIAHGLYRRLHTAWWLTTWLLCAGILLSLLKGFDYEEASVLAVVVVMLASARERFRRRASLIDQQYSTAWIVAFFVVLGTAGWLVLFAYRHLPYDNELWWQFAFQASAPRSLRASLLAVLIAAAYGLWRVLRPAPPRFSPPRRRTWSALRL